jgi:hypothetical protein
MRYLLFRLLAPVALCSLGAGTAANAHHSFAVHFVGDKTVTVAGVVTAFSFRNPHGLVSLDVVDVADGGAIVGRWTAETNSPNILRRRGWTADSIRPGDRVTIEGYPARDGSNSMRIYRVTYADGRELTGQRPSVGIADGQD